MVKTVGALLSTSYVTPRTSLLAFCKFPADRKDRAFVFSVGRRKETLGMKEWQNAVVPSTHRRAVRTMKWCVPSEAATL